MSKGSALNSAALTADSLDPDAPAVHYRATLYTPTARYDHALRSLDGGRSLLLFGGARSATGSTNFFNDYLEFSLGSCPPSYSVLGRDCVRYNVMQSSATVLLPGQGPEVLVTQPFVAHRFYHFRFLVVEKFCTYPKARNGQFHAAESKKGGDDTAQPQE